MNPDDLRAAYFRAFKAEQRKRRIILGVGISLLVAAVCLLARLLTQ
jgi:hypothetical protein